MPAVEPQSIAPPVEGFILKYGGENNSVDANTLINSLLHMTTVMQEIGKFLDPEQAVKINIKANAPGSFHVEFEVLRALVVNLWHHYGGMAQAGATVLTILNQLIQLKKNLKGKQPKEITYADDSVTIVNEDGESLTVEQPVYALYNENPVIDKALSKHFETLDEDKAVSGFELLTPEKKPVLVLPREQFYALSSEVEPAGERAQTIMAPEVSVSISKLLWDQRKKWDFIYNGNKISAKITDAFFNDKIDKSIVRFAKGDRMVVNLKIIQVWDEEYHAWINKTYEVIEVLRFFRAPTQEEFDFGKTSGESSI